MAYIASYTNKSPSGLGEDRVTTQAHGREDELAALLDEISANDLQPLWLQNGLLPAAPSTLSPYIWRWQTLRALAARCGDLVGIDLGGDRRVLALSHPDLGGLPFATHTLWAAVQYLNPGERAPAHRHSPAALRFVLEGSGVWTLVNGEPIAMARGDLVLTPSYTWHEHDNPGSEPMMWFDGLDLPLIRNLDAIFFEPGANELTPYEQADQSASEHWYGGPGLLPTKSMPLDANNGVGAHSPLLAYRWEHTDAQLSLLASTKTTASVRFTDPTSGRDVMPTLRAEMHRFCPGHRTPTTRTVGSSVWVVYRGAGASVINGTRYRWARGDIFVVPSWSAVDHEAMDLADVFVLSDGPVIEAIGLGRTETLPEHQEVIADATA